MSEAQWFHDDEFDERLPERVSDEVKRFYGQGRVGAEFAQMLASFLNHTSVLVEPPDPDQ